MLWWIASGNSWRSGLAESTGSLFSHLPERFRMGTQAGWA